MVQTVNGNTIFQGIGSRESALSIAQLLTATWGGFAWRRGHYLQIFPVGTRWPWWWGNLIWHGKSFLHQCCYGNISIGRSEPRKDFKIPYPISMERLRGAQLRYKPVSTLKIKFSMLCPHPSQPVLASWSYHERDCLEVGALSYNSEEDQMGSWTNSILHYSIIIVLYSLDAQSLNHKFLIHQQMTLLVKLTNK